MVGNSIHVVYLIASSYILYVYCTCWPIYDYEAGAWVVFVKTYYERSASDNPLEFVCTVKMKVS